MVGSQVFGIERFRECELIHGRWAMLACLGCIVAEAATGVSWVEAGKVELDGAQYFNQSLPFSISQVHCRRCLLLSPTPRCSLVPSTSSPAAVCSLFFGPVSLRLPA
jgi:Chlorophyll A-B binding protein